MYNKVEGGTLEVIQGIECWVPPVGYGVDRLTGELVHIGVHTSSPKNQNRNLREYFYQKTTTRKD